MFKDRYALLNQKQRVAVDTIDGPVMVIAGPGSGKTELLGVRVAHILESTDTPPSGILCLTFTDAAATNLRERLIGLVGEAAYQIHIFTFHAFAAYLMQRFGEYYPGFGVLTIAEPLAQRNILLSVFNDLAFDDPLRTEHPSEGYVFFSSVREHITDFKKGGLTPEAANGLVEDFARECEVLAPILAPLEARVSKKMIPVFEEVLGTLNDLPCERETSIIKLLARDLEKALALVDEEGTKALSAFKSTYIEKGSLVFAKRLEKYRSLVRIYASYQERLYNQGFADFDDAILMTVRALTEHHVMRETIQEEYLYTMVDEFQDTNAAQMKLLSLVLDHPVHEGRPNVLVVGDDDQAIYKFQGADYSNIGRFFSLYRGVQVVTLTDNYRSHEGIVSLASAVREHINDSVESLLPGIEKTISAMRSADPLSNVGVYGFDHVASEYGWIADRIQEEIARGISPSEIAVVAKKHRQLMELAPWLAARDISVSLDRTYNVLEVPIVSLLLELSRTVHAIQASAFSHADASLMSWLGHPVWGFDRIILWRFQRSVKETREPLVIGLLKSEDERLRLVGEWLHALAGRAALEPARVILDELVGVLDPEGVSPLCRSFLLSGVSGCSDSISALRSLYERFGAYMGNQRGLLVDFITYIDAYIEAGESIIDTFTQIRRSDAVSLITAHSSKGREFEHVFVLSATQSIWTSRGRADKVPLVPSWGLSREPDTAADYARLFYVAATRAKESLYITTHEQNDSGRAQVVAPFVHQYDIERPATSERVLEPAILSRTVFSSDEEMYLREITGSMSFAATHLKNFYNVADGGPQRFLERNVYLLPQAPIPSAIYGTAIHAALEYIYRTRLASGNIPSIEEVVALFTSRIEHSEMADHERVRMTERGIHALKGYYAHYASEFADDYQVEVDFAQQGVVIGDISLRGKIDKLIRRGDDVVVFDYKTGKALTSWEERGDEYQKIKGYQYRQQLAFYKLLVEQSRMFKGARMQKGVLDFVEPHEESWVRLEADIADAEVEHVVLLVRAMAHLVRNLDFVDTSGYPPTLSGIKQFEVDCISKLK